jgi:dihydroflavonol-4-reductase
LAPYRVHGRGAHPLSDQDLVLVTGASGFIAKHVIRTALARGYRVRGTLRHLDREAEVRSAVGEGGERLSFVAADLTSDAGWASAAAGCRYVLHTASPLSVRQPRDPNVLVAPAREGTLRVLGAAAPAGVERTVITSSIAAMAYDATRPRDHVLTEADWSNTDGPIAAYPLSKTLAEQAAWDFIAADRSGMALSVVNPCVVLGPTPDADISASGQIVRLLLSGRVPFLPPVAFTVVDVRDVAEAHLRAMETPEAAGERFIIASEPMWVKDMAMALREAFPALARRIPRREIPAGLVRMIARFLPGMQGRDVGVLPRMSNAKARQVLGIDFRSGREAVVEMGRSLIALNAGRGGRNG